MKVLLVISVAVSTAFAFISTGSPKEVFETWGERAKQFPQCFTLTGATEEEFDQYFALIKIPATRNFKCYLNCLYYFINLLNDDGTINKEELFKEVTRLTNDIFDLCTRRMNKKEDPCEKLYEFVYCILHDEDVYAGT